MEASLQHLSPAFSGSEWTENAKECADFPTPANEKTRAPPSPTSCRIPSCPLDSNATFCFAYTRRTRCHGSAGGNFDLWMNSKVLSKFTSRIICTSYNMDDEHSLALILQLMGSGSLAGLQTRAINGATQSRRRGNWYLGRGIFAGASYSCL